MISLFSLFMCISSYFLVSSDTSGILDQWPENGPKLIFEINNLGNGYASPTVTDENLYVTGEIDSIGYLFSYDLKGNLKWKTSYGNEWATQYPGSRSAPTLVGDLIYTCSGKGDITCFDAKNGAMKWSLNMIRDLEGVEISFGHSMPLLIEGDILFCSPSGEKNNIVALNRYTGKLIWSTAANSETAGYGSPLVISMQNRKILINSSEFSILGLDAATGEKLWSYELSFKGNQPCNKPLYDGKYLYWIAGSGNGAVAAQLSPDGGKINIVWKNLEFDTFFGGFVQIGDYLYGSSDSRREYVSVDANSGNFLDSLSFGIGSTILAENMLIFYNQQGKIGLVRPNKEKLELVSYFRITKGTGEHFSHPVYSNGKLFIRRGNTLLAYNIGKNEQN
jgi:outer membrane protein assembly factor BamB